MQLKCLYQIRNCFVLNSSDELLNVQYADMHTCDLSDTKNASRTTSSVILQVLLELICLFWPANIMAQNNGKLTLNQTIPFKLQAEHLEGFLNCYTLGVNNTVVFKFCFAIMRG